MIDGLALPVEYVCHPVGSEVITVIQVDGLCGTFPIALY